MKNSSFDDWMARTRGIRPDAVGNPTRQLHLGLATKDPHMQWIIHLALRVARTNLPVLITGETGTGKEVLARQIHMNSLRAGARFVAQNCSAIPPNLLESEMFGYKRGAFSGAMHDRRGLFDIADGGTVFLDEVGDLPAEAQPKLLRVIQEGEIWPLGAEKPHRVNVRIIAATNHDLEADVKVGRFRDDLFYRLSVFPITLPPLRSRRSDIPVLVEYFATIYAERCGKPRRGISSEVLALLEQYHFPGNIRELENLIARAIVLMDEGEVLLPEHFPTLKAISVGPATLREQVKRFKAEVVLDAIRHEGSMTRAARRLGMSARNLSKLCHRLGLSGLSAPKSSGISPKSSAAKNSVRSSIPVS
jgi:transcriptional regulator with GAF, ATPase, and Fis domain